MATLADSLVSSSARPLRLRKRPDLSARRQVYLGKSYWVVKEPVGLNYFRFQEEEFAILQMLDGRTSLDEIKERFEEQFPPQKVTLDELQNFVGMLHRSGLLIADVPGQGRQLAQRRKERRRRELFSSLGNILCVRFKGVDPERFLNWLYPRVRWCFTRWWLAVTCLLMLGALLLVTVQFEVFRSRLPAFHDFFNFYNALWLAATLAVTKILHEFGHGLTCKHFGGECHEMGVMILVLTPCLYCNVSDSWMLPNKWHRMAIGAAGIWVELTLAAICTFIWWFTEPGLLNYMCLNVMFVCSVSTVIFNGNPLLRYDGYYVLADLLEIPNLRQKASTILGRKAAEWFLGIEPPEDPFLPQRRQGLFVLYTIAAVCYRWLVLAGIWWFLFQVFKPYGLQRIGQLIVLASLVTLVGVPLYQIGKFFYIPGRLEKVKKPRMYASLGVLGVLLLAFLFLPLPHSVMCTFQIEPRDAEPVYVAVPGGAILEEVFVRPGQQVGKGDLLARLRSDDLEQKIIELEGKCEQYRRRLERLKSQRFYDPQAGAEISGVEKLLATVETQLQEKLADRQRLELRAPIGGTVLPPPARSEPPAGSGKEMLPTWSGTPLDPENLGAYLDEGVLFCLIGDPSKYEALLVIDQTDIELVSTGQRVELKLDELPHRTLKYNTSTATGGKIEYKPLVIADIGPAQLEVAPRSLSAKAQGELPTKTDPTSGVERPRSTSYPAHVPLDDPDGVLRIGLRGRAKVHVAPMPLSVRLWRLLAHTLSFRL